MSPRQPLPDAKRHPLVGRLDPAVAPLVCPLHDHAVAQGRSGYIDPVSDRWVFTAAYLWERAECCANDCRHCPYTHGPRYDANGVPGV
jgi:hypothetical protein